MDKTPSISMSLLFIMQCKRAQRFKFTPDYAKNFLRVEYMMTIHSQRGYCVHPDIVRRWMLYG